MGLLVYEIFCSRLLSVVIGPHMVFVALALAMLGLSCAGSILSLFRIEIETAQRRNEILALMCLFLGLGCMVSLVLLSYRSGVWNQYVESLLGKDAGGKWWLALAKSSIRDSLLVGAILCLPYFLFGIAITVLFECSDTGIYTRLYFSDLAGAATGCVVAMVAFEFGGYPAGLAIVLALPFVAALIFAWGSSRRLSVAGALLLVATFGISFNPGLRARLEPEPPLSLTARNHEGKKEVERVWHAWNNYTRVEQLEYGSGSTVFALGQGQGHARLMPYDPDPENPERLNEEIARIPTARLASVLHPERVLVLLAGVGQDMIGIDHMLNGNVRITGVELNRPMIDRALELETSNLGEFLAQERIDLVVHEGREFLERDRSHYDSILISYAGASVSDHMGATGGTQQFLFTKEAFKSYVDHLAPSGTLVLFSFNKLQQIGILRELHEENGWPNFEESIVILRDANYDPSLWVVAHDQLRVIYRKGGFDEASLEAIRAMAEDMNMVVAFGPEGYEEELQIFQKILTRPDWKEILSGLSRNILVDLSPTTDNRPYATWLMPSWMLLDPPFWRGERGPTTLGRRAQFVTLSAIMLAAIFLVLGPLLLKAGPKRSRRNAIHLQYFMCLGAGFMLVETGLVMKFSLLLGNPGYSIGVILAALILSTGIGSFASGRLFHTGQMNYTRAAIGLLIALAVSLACYEFTLEALLALPRLVKMGVAVILVALPGFFMGQLFPQGLRVVREEDPKLVPWAWAINGAFSTIGASLAVFIAPFWGLYTVIGSGAFLYFLILFLPIYGWARLPAAKA